MKEFICALQDKRQDQGGQVDRDINEKLARAKSFSHTPFTHTHSLKKYLASDQFAATFSPAHEDFLK